MSLIWGLSEISSYLRLDYEYLVEYNRNGTVLFSEYNTKKYTLPSLPVTGNVPCEHLVKVLSAKLLQYESMFYLLNNKHLVSICGEMFEII